MNFSSIVSLDLRDVCTSKDCGERQEQSLEELFNPHPEKKPFHTNLSEGQDPFLRPNHTALHHQEVVIDLTIAREASLQTK